MADGITFDFSDVTQLVGQLEDVGHNAGKYVRDAVDKSSLAIKKDWQERATGMKGLAQYPGHIGYDFAAFQGFGSTVLRTDIGPSKRGQGNLGAIIENGAPHFSPRGHGKAALAAESPHFEELLDQALRNAEHALTFLGGVSSILRGV